MDRTSMTGLNAKSDGLPIIRSVHNIPEERVRWLWPRRIPLGKLTMLVGDPGVGKSFLTADIAARVSTGRDWPDGPPIDRLCGDVLMLMCEDDPGDTLRPRLAAAGADLERVHVLEGFRGLTSGERAGFVTLDKHLEVVARALKVLPLPRLLVIDPITAYLGAVDGNSNTEVRAVLSRVGNLARAFGIAVLMVSHLNKDSASGGRAVYRTMGALAFTAVSRVVYFAKKDAGESRVLLPVKSNLLINRDAMSFTILEDGCLGWISTDIRVDPVEVESEQAPLASIEEAERWLRSLLENGPVASAEVMRRCEQDGLAFVAIRRARERIGVEMKREGFRNGRWVWCLKRGEEKNAEPERENPRHAAPAVLEGAGGGGSTENGGR